MTPALSPLSPLSPDKVWYAARTRRNQEKVIKTRLEQIGVEHFIPFRREVRTRKDRRVELLVPVIPNIVFIYTDYQTSLATVNDFGIRLSYIRQIDGRGRLVVPQKQMDDFKLICQSNVSYSVSGPETFAKGDRVVVVGGCLTGLEGELIHAARNGGRVILKLDHIASFELTISVNNLRKIK
ncbi:MAG: UpxY family transcription antiterminator [Alistipes sp.]|jgi:transcription antitermination factor NusG|nr:UpxY family transcription antiterminator [Alistipes sp.]